MISCLNIENNTIDLNGIKSAVFSVDAIISSKKVDGTPTSYFVDIVSSEYVTVHKSGNDVISIEIETPKILKKEYVILKNTENEKLEINILPNLYFTTERKYKFKITKKYIDENGNIKIKLLSKVNNEEIGWKCTYMGQPLSYKIEPLSSHKSGYVTITLLSKIKVNNEYYVPFKFRQDESNNEVKLKVTYTRDGVILS